MADEEVELQAVGLDLSWAAARLGSATPRARVVHMHPPPPHTYAHTFLQARRASVPSPHPHNPDLSPKLLKFPCPLSSGLTFACPSFAGSRELWVVKYVMEICYMLAWEIAKV